MPQQNPTTLQQNATVGHSTARLGQQPLQRVPGLDAVKSHSKLMVLGKPGSGKTTFLKHIAIQCDRAKFEPNKIPIFINLIIFY